MTTGLLFVTLASLDGQVAEWHVDAATSTRVLSEWADAREHGGRRRTMFAEIDGSTSGFDLLDAPLISYKPDDEES